MANTVGYCSGCLGFLALLIALGKSLSLPGPQFPHSFLLHGDDDNPALSTGNSLRQKLPLALCLCNAWHHGSLILARAYGCYHNACNVISFPYVVAVVFNPAVS